MGGIDGIYGGLHCKWCEIHGMDDGICGGIQCCYGEIQGMYGGIRGVCMLACLLWMVVCMVVFVVCMVVYMVRMVVYMSYMNIPSFTNFNFSLMLTLAAGCLADHRYR